MFFEKVITKANPRIRLFLFLIFILPTFPLFSQQPTEKTAAKAFKQYLNFQLDSCAQTLNNTTLTPDAFYLEILLASTKLFVDEDEALYKASKTREAELADQLDKSNFSEAYTNFLKSEIKLHRGLIKLKYGDEFSGFWSLKQAYGAAKKNVEEYPDFLPSYKTLGLCHILYGVLPKKYNWILSLLGIEGNVTQGLEELKKVSDSKDFYALESTMTEALAYGYLLNSPKKGADILSKIQSKKNHLLIDYAYALVLMKDARSDLALEIIQKSALNFPQPFAVPQLYYLLGEIYLQLGNYDRAVENYKKFLTVFKGQNLIKDAYYKIGICCYLEDKPAESVRYFDLSKQKGQAKNETDKNAQNALENEITATKELFKLRYATDGGYYTRAAQILKQTDTLSLNNHDKCEFYYRSGRLYQKSGEISKAKAAYKKTIKAQNSDKWYFAPNAALQLGLLLIDEKNKDEARYYLNIIDNYDGYPYQNSITQQAAAALKSID